MTGGNISSIMGTLKANGKVYLINPSGVIFGENSVIDTGALVASTLDLPDQLFLQNGNLLFSGDSNGLIANYGAITASNGDVILIGYQVENSGTIDAEKGVAALGAGHRRSDQKIYSFTRKHSFT